MLLFVFHVFGIKFILNHKHLKLVLWEMPIFSWHLGLHLPSSCSSKCSELGDSFEEWPRVIPEHNSHPVSAPCMCHLPNRIPLFFVSRKKDSHKSHSGGLSRINHVTRSKGLHPWICSKLSSKLPLKLFDFSAELSFFGSSMTVRKDLEGAEPPASGTGQAISVKVSVGLWLQPDYDVTFEDADWECQNRCLLLMISCVAEESPSGLLGTSSDTKQVAYSARWIGPEPKFWNSGWTKPWIYGLLVAVLAHWHVSRI